MPATTHSEFNGNTEALEVAQAFSEGIRGKTILVTGGNAGGIGFTTCQAFASQSPAHIIIAGRTPSKIQECVDLLKAKYPDVDYRALIVDLSSQKSVRSAAAEALGWADLPTIDIIVNTAGVMGMEERTLSEDGVEMHFATNHIGHWLLTCKLMPKLIAAAAADPHRGATRVINVSSASPTISNGIRWSDIKFEKLNRDLPAAEQPNYAFVKPWGYEDPEDKAYIGLEAYNNSKVANVLFGVGANRRLYENHGVLVLAVHPGVIKTELGRYFPAKVLESVGALFNAGVFTYKSQGAGAATSLVAALDPKLGPGVTRDDGVENYGAFLDDCQISDKARPNAVSSSEAEKLWKLSEELVGEKFEW